MLAFGLITLVQLAPSQCLMNICSPGPLTKCEPTAQISLAPAAATPLRSSESPQGLAGVAITSPAGPNVGALLLTATVSPRVALRGDAPAFLRCSTTWAVTV